MTNHLEKVKTDFINSAIDRAIDQYIETRRAKIPDFVQKYFSINGALKLHKKAFSSDLYKGPINIFWALPYAGMKATTSLLKKMGNQKIPTYFEKVPRGFVTNVQKEVVWLIYTELLELPYRQGNRKSAKDALLEEILNQPEVAKLLIEQLEQIHARSNDPKFRQVLENNLMEYSASRTAAAELAGSIITLSVGAAMFKKMTPGAMATGSLVATAIAQQAAISNFVLGPTLGSVYYSIFPAAASMGLFVATTGTIMAALSLVTSFAGIIVDPMQAKLGLHQRRLKKFIDCLEIELKGSGESKLELKDQYVARILDIVDLLKTATLRFA